VCRSLRTLQSSAEVALLYARGGRTGDHGRVRVEQRSVTVAQNAMRGLLNIVRRHHQLVIVVTAIVPFACGRTTQTNADPQKAAASAPTSTAGAPSSAPEENAAPRPTAVIRFATVADELAKRCASKTAPETNMDVKAQAVEQNRCRRTAMTAQLDLFLRPLKETDAVRFKARMAEQAEFNRYADGACWVAGQSAWVDFEQGTREDDNLRWARVTECESDIYTERFFYAHVLRANDVAAIAKRVVALHDRGQRAKRDLERMRDRGADLANRAIPAYKAGSGLPLPLTRAERVELQTKIAAALDAPPSIARATCSAWSELAAALGGATACSSALALYYYAPPLYGLDPGAADASLPSTP
jgi:hypothetical protein